MKKIFQIFFLITLDFLVVPLQGQSDEYNYYYRVYFRDKGENKISDFTPNDLFTQRAINRREKNGIMGLDLKDIPVSKEYTDIISSMGLKLHCTSRWMNTALFKSVGPSEIETIQVLPFVENVKIVKNPVSKGQHWDKFELEVKDEINPYMNPTQMVNGEIVHSSGYQGWGKLIAVMDGGFLNLDKLPAFETLINNNGIISTYDFVRRNSFVYDYHIHGSDVMCILAGDYAINQMGRGYEGFNGIAGMAQGAYYLLLRTEDTFSEFPVEEDFWTAGAEYADSAGCDIITSSLGYCTFDDPSMDYKFSDMDGNTVFITQAAEAAASRGIVLVNSAGNERNQSWDHIIAPADGENVISVGAVDWVEHITTFSSPGPSSDGRIKPDVVAQGSYLLVQELDEWDGLFYSDIVFVSGTSFSCPVISGMIACLMQAVPEAKASEIVSVIREVSDRFDSPDNDYGYGIPDMVKAVEILQRKYIEAPSDVLTIGPNPFTDHINITFRDSPEWLSIELFDAMGHLVSQYNKTNYIGLNITLRYIQNLRPGIYYLRLSSAQGNFTYKLIKARM